MSIDGNGRRVACDPYIGAAEAVCECAANLACVGAEPLGLTNCLNFGNPEKPHVAWQLTRAVEGMGAACRALRRPVVGGNVSLYNEGPRARSTRRRSSAWSASCPTPAGAGGAAFPLRRAGTRERADMVALDRPVRALAAGSELAKLRGRAERGPAAVRPRGGAAHARAGARGGAGGSRPQRARRLRRRARVRASPRARSWGGVGATLDLEPLMRRAEVDARDGAVRRGPGGIVVSGPREALHGAEQRSCRAWASWRSARWAATPIRITAGAATIDLSVEEAGGVFPGLAAVP